MYSLDIGLIAKRESSGVGIHSGGKRLEVLEIFSDFNGIITIQENREEGLGGAGIRNDLVGEEELRIIDL